jgi:transcriptional regulator
MQPELSTDLNLAPNQQLTPHQKLLDWVFGCIVFNQNKKDFLDRAVYLTESEDGETLYDAVDKVSQMITKREWDVLNERLGLDGSKSKTFEEVARLLGVTRERIRQIEAKGLRKLRHPFRNVILRPFFREPDAEDIEALEGRLHLHELIKGDLGESLAKSLVQRTTRYYLPQAIRAAEEGFPKELNRAIAYSCQVVHTFTPCGLCGEPVPPGLDWCLSHLSMYKRNQMVLICDGCGTKFPRDLAHMTGFLSRVGRTQHKVYHDKACFYEHCSELFQKIRRKPGGRKPKPPSTD